MLEITASNAADYLRAAGRIGANETVAVRELTGGVSNVVLLVTLPARGERFVLKQARGRLRVQEEWLCPVERIWREVEMLRICGQLLQARGAKRDVSSGAAQDSRPSWLLLFRPEVPAVLWEDRDNYLFAMTAAADRNRTWKQLLLAGKTTLSMPIAAACGWLLGSLHAGSWDAAAKAGRLEDRQYFDKLRLDPYYRHTARAHPDLAPRLAELVDSVWANRWCLVHGDFSPKNLLVWPGQLMLIDFEVGHYGDPAFDLGFFLTHLVVKAIRSREACRQYLQLVAVFWREYRRPLAAAVADSELADLQQRMLLNLAGCLLARVDGKSPLEYLSDSERQVIRQLGRAWLLQPPDSLF